MAASGHDRRTIVAFAAACVLVLQTALAAWAAGAMPMPQLDAFGNPLCITSSDDGGASPGHSTPSNCCEFGCVPAALPLLAPERSAIALPELAVLGTSVPVLREAPSAAPDHDPGSPRAPPASV